MKHYIVKHKDSEFVVFVSDIYCSSFYVDSLGHLIFQDEDKFTVASFSKDYWLSCMEYGVDNEKK